jgi:hypothetical protein
VFSFQPLSVSRAELQARGIEVSDRERVNRINGQLRSTLTPTPLFSERADSLRLAIEVQLDIVFELGVSGVAPERQAGVLKENFGAVGDVLRKSDVTASQYGLAAARAGYAGKGTEESQRYEKALRGTFSLARGVLQNFAANLPESVSPEARAFLKAALARLPRVQ